MLALGNASHASDVMNHSAATMHMDACATAGARVRGP